MHDNDESETVVKMFFAEILKHNVITLLLSTNYPQVRTETFQNFRLVKEGERMPVATLSALESQDSKHDDMTVPVFTSRAMTSRVSKVRRATAT